MRQAMQYAADQSAQLVNRYQPRARSKSGKYRGLDPSKPYSPPKRVTGTLFRSIRYSVDRYFQLIVGRWGTNLDYGLLLERGTCNMKPRPYLRPVFILRRVQIWNLITKGGARR
jgi:hypothetical protein